MAEYWYLWLILLGLIVLTIVVFIFASRAVSSHNKEVRKTEEEIKRLTELKNKYKDLTPELVSEAQPRELLDGVYAVLQSKIEKAENAEKEFEGFTEPQKFLYTLYYFIEDTQDSLSFFFKNNGEELKNLIVPALNSVGYTSFLTETEKLYDMYNDNNETASIDNDIIAECDKKFKNVFGENELLNKIQDYINRNIEVI